MIQSIPPARIGAAALALALALGFLVSGIVALRLPQNVIAPPPSAPTETEAQPPADLRYMGLRDTLMVAAGDAGRIGLELGVMIEAADLSRAQMFLRDNAGAVDAPLGEALLRMIEDHQVATQGWAALRAALPETMRTALNDRFEEAGEGRPILEVLVIDFTAR
jgi:hypothetical protein